jgi:hypothetical protein
MADSHLSLSWRVFWMPKAGHGRDEYEDAFAGDPATGRFAIADGASESAFAGAWAELLVKGFTSQAGPGPRWLPEARKAWHETFKNRELSWYAEDKFLEGAYATFLGVVFEGPKLHWHALAVGDSCLFHIRDHQLLEAFPVRQAKAFGNQPSLVSSRKASKRITRLQKEGDWLKGDQLFLMTDALAQWFLQKTEEHREPWKEVLSIATQEAFEAWIMKKRDSKEMRNDDVTLGVIGSTQSA